MYSHEPEDYNCPFCELVKLEKEKSLLSKQKNVFYSDEFITAFLSIKSWPNNKWNVLIIPNKHFENMYNIPDELIAKIHIFSKKVAIAFKEIYKCDWVSIRQHNEPAWNQWVWHYHLHVFPRYKDDNLYKLHLEGALNDEKERAEFAENLRKYFK